MKTLIYLVRHGQSIGNANHIYLGHTDMDLSELGYEQAQITAEHLKDIDFEAVYSSDLMCAHNTALPHAKMRNLDVIDSKELRELNIGDWEGVSTDVLKSEHYDDFIVGWLENFGTFCLPNGERVSDGAERMYNEVLRIAKAHPDAKVLIASHAAVIRAFWGKISGIEPEKLASEIPFPTNASYSTVIFDGERLIPDKFSCDEQFLV